MTLHQILKDPECRGNIQCAMWGIVITTAMLCVPIYGIAWMSTAEKISADVYGAKHLENRIETLENFQNQMMVRIEKNHIEFEVHTHRYSDGHIK